MRYQFLRFPNGKSKAVTLSYDDACPQDVRFSEIISRYGLKCTFNLNSPTMRGDAALSKETVETCFLANGHEIAVHGYFHKAPGIIRPIEGIRDVLECRTELEQTYGHIIRGMAYPDSGITNFANGTDFARIKNYLTDLGIVYARTLGGDNNSFLLPEDWHRWMPTAHHNNPHIFDYIDEFVNLQLPATVYHAARYPRLFYLWGHSYEFDLNQNWDRLTEICEKLAGKDDIWYATNMEIYEYVNAYNALVYSADGTMVYNPTLFTVWFDVDGKPYEIKSGETITL
ncbi:MAG: polysaccharide deacetylase family protein [Clostridia bacterium]|nr:polysaccharide deacetylase family protein [Clostridia bacterium]